MASERATSEAGQSWTQKVSHQLPILASRYAECLIGDFKSILLLIGQAPLIGWFCVIVWSDVEHDTDTLRFILSLASVWFGCITACREIAKERDILERERFFGLSLTAYVVSKVLVLAAVSASQVVLLQMTVEWHIGIRGNMLLQMFALFCASLCGMGLGLLVSAIASTQEQAVFSVPLLIIPQILFSEFAIPKEQFGNIVDAIENFMPVKWAYLVFEQTASTTTEWKWVFWSYVVMLGYTALLVLLCQIALVPRRQK